MSGIALKMKSNIKGLLIKQVKFSCVAVIVCVFSFSVFGEEIEGGQQDLKNNKVVGLNLTCKPKMRRVTILSGFSVNSVYNHEKVRKWYSGRPSEFIPVEIRVDESGAEIMKGAMFGSRGRRSYIQYKDGTHPSSYDIYAMKDEWNCSTKQKNKRVAK
jgi:hypothetical protein